MNQLARCIATVIVNRRDKKCEAPLLHIRLVRFVGRLMFV